MVHILWLAMYIGLGALFMGIAMPMIQGRVRPNPWYGFRTPKTLRDERTWYAANAYSGKTLFLVGLLTAGAALFLLPFAWLFRLSAEGYNNVCLAVLMLGLIWSVAESFRYLRKL